MWLRAPGGDQELSEQGEKLVLPTDQSRPAEAPNDLGSALLLLAAMAQCLSDIQNSNARICAALERLLPNTADDPRYKQTGSWR